MTLIVTLVASLVGSPNAAGASARSQKNVDERPTTRTKKSSDVRPLTATRKKPVARDECYLVGLGFGATLPTAGGVAWRTGWTGALELGYIPTGCRRYAWRFGISLVGAIAQFHGTAKLFTRGDVLLLGRLARRLGPLWLGLRVASGVRIARDGRFPETRDPASGEVQRRYVHVGFNFGLELNWPIARFVELTFHGDYLLSPTKLSNQNYAEHRGQPYHAFDLRLGALFLF